MTHAISQERIFTESAPRPIQSISCNVRDLYVVTCLWSVHVWKPHFPVDWRLLVEERIANNWHNWRFQDFAFSMIFWDFDIFLGFWSWQTSLLCLAEEIAGGRSVAVAVGVSDMWQVTCKTGLVTCYTWHVTSDTWHVFLLLSRSVSLGFGIVAIIRKGRDIQCLPYPGLIIFFSFLDYLSLYDPNNH